MKVDGKQGTVVSLDIIGKNYMKTKKDVVKIIEILK